MPISKHEEKMVDLRMQMQHNQVELQDYLADLDNWENDVKDKEQHLKVGKTGQMEDLPPVRNTIQKKKMKKKKKDTEPNKTKRISGFDFNAWDKFDVDKALEEIDMTEHKTSSSEYETDEEWEIERKKHLANLEKDKGNEFLKKGEYEDAVEAYTKGITFDATNAVLPANRAMALLKQQKYAAAELDCTVSISLDPLYVKAYLRRASARASLGKLDESMSDYSHVLDLEPSNKQAKSEIERLHKELKREKEGPISSTLAEEGKGIVKPIYKQPEERSKAPLKRIHIEEIGIESSGQQHPANLAYGATAKKVAVQEEENFEKLLTESAPQQTEPSSSIAVEQSDPRQTEPSSSNAVEQSDPRQTEPSSSNAVEQSDPRQTEPSSSNAVEQSDPRQTEPSSSNAVEQSDPQQTEPSSSNAVEQSDPQQTEPSSSNAVEQSDPQQTEPSSSNAVEQSDPRQTEPSSSNAVEQSDPQQTEPSSSNAVESNLTPAVGNERIVPVNVEPRDLSSQEQQDSCLPVETRIEHQEVLTSTIPSNVLKAQKRPSWNAASNVESNQSPKSMSGNNQRNATSRVEAERNGTRLPGEGVNIPQTSFQFQADFRLFKNKPEAFFQYFQAIPPSHYPKLFGQSLDADMLMAILKSLAANVSSGTQFDGTFIEKWFSTSERYFVIKPEI